MVLEKQLPLITAVLGKAGTSSATGRTPRGLVQNYMGEHSPVTVCDQLPILV